MRLNARDRVAAELALQRDEVVPQQIEYFLPANGGWCAQVSVVGFTAIGVADAITVTVTSSQIVVRRLVRRNSNCKSIPKSWPFSRAIVSCSVSRSLPLMRTRSP